jgi:hypothetical protein
MKSFAWAIVRTKYRISRGQSWVAFFKDAVYVYIAILALEDLLKRFGIVDPILIKYLLIIMVPLYFLGCYIVGLLDERWGIWKMESVWGSRELNPFMERLNEMIKEIHESVVKIDNELMIEYKNKYEKKYEEKYEKKYEIDKRVDTIRDISDNKK